MFATLKVLLAAVFIVAWAACAPVYVGVLEPPAQNARQEAPFRVRVAFQFLDGHWRAMPHEADDEQSLQKLAGRYPARLSWNVAFDGRKIGAVESVRHAYTSYSEIGTQALTLDSKPPAIRDNAKAFATWMGVAEFRPLVVISQPNYSDPDHWKLFQPPPELGRQARGAFRKVIPKLLCEDEQTAYFDADIRLLDKAYRSAAGDMLIALRAVPARHRCETNQDGWGSVWFLVSHGGFHLVGTGLTLLDAGDYDGDGASEIIFQSSGYNRDSYVLFHVRSRTSTEFAWSYH